MMNNESALRYQNSQSMLTGDNRRLIKGPSIGANASWTPFVDAKMSSDTAHHVAATV